jgi:hypothetical protein
MQGVPETVGVLSASGPFPGKTSRQSPDLEDMSRRSTHSVSMEPVEDPRFGSLAQVNLNYIGVIPAGAGPSRAGSISADATRLARSTGVGAFQAPTSIEAICFSRPTTR